MSARKRTATPPKRAEKPAEVKVTPAKGRPMLTWVGKRPLTRVTSFPAQHVGTFDPSGDAAERTGPEWDEWPASYPRGGLLFHGDNKEVLAHLLANGFRGKVDLIYIDPPFDSGADYVRRVSLRGAKGTARLDGDGYTLGEQIQYTDIWANDNYVQFMYERLLLLRELLREGGSLFLHCDHRRDAQLRLLLDEVFGAERLVNEIIWRSTTFTGSSKALATRFPTNHNTILWYSKGDAFTFNKVREDYSDEYRARFTNPDDDPRGPWQSVSLRTYSQETFDRLKEEGRLISPARPGAGWRFKYYLSEAKGRVVETLWLELEVPPTSDERRAFVEEHLSTIWLDINMANAMAEERTGFPTQKPQELLERIISATSNSRDLVLDCFIGSGTTAAASQVLGRRWIGCDINKGAIHTTSKRLQEVIGAQIEAANQGTLVDGDAPSPAQLSFTVWRVNDYDLQIQHNEAVNLAGDHIGIQRTRTDRFFDGTLGKSVVKIAPFTHPLSPADLEEIRQELEARPEDDRNVTAVCLGIELAAQAWLEDWNRHRRGKNAVNRIEVIELRTDERYGAWLAHEPDRAKVRIERKKNKIHVTIEDFVSPTIVKRLAEQTGVVEPRIDEWQAMVDCVMIDGSYDGEVFDIALSDVPERKTDLVSGTYELDAPKGKTTIAVKIVDMLGEEVLVTKQV